MIKMNEYYTSSSGEIKKLSEMNTTYVTNALAKKMREVFEAKTPEEADKVIKEIQNLKEEAFKRINIYTETLGENENGK